MKFLTIFLLLASMLMADSDERKHDRHHLPLDMSYLDLTREQHMDVEEIVKKYKHESRQLHRQKKRVRKTVSELFSAETFDTEEFIRLNSALQQKSVEAQAEFFSRMHKILTPKQKRLFIYYMEEWEIE